MTSASLSARFPTLRSDEVRLAGFEPRYKSQITNQVTGVPVTVFFKHSTNRVKAMAYDLQVITPGRSCNILKFASRRPMFNKI